MIRRLRTALYVLRHGDVPADVYARVAADIDDDNAAVDQLLAARFAEAARADARAGFGDKLDDVMAVRAIHAEKARLVLVGGA